MLRGLKSYHLMGLGLREFRKHLAVAKWFCPSVSFYFTFNIYTIAKSDSDTFYSRVFLQLEDRNKPIFELTKLS